MNRGPDDVTRDADFAEGVRRSAEFMRLHEDEPNEYRPRTYECATCGTRCYEEGDSADLAWACKGDCGEKLCTECATKTPYCASCILDRAEAVAALAARLEAEIEKNKDALLRTMNA